MRDSLGMPRRRRRGGGLFNYGPQGERAIRTHLAPTQSSHEKKDRQSLAIEAGGSEQEEERDSSEILARSYVSPRRRTHEEEEEQEKV